METNTIKARFTRYILKFLPRARAELNKNDFIQNIPNLIDERKFLYVITLCAAYTILLGFLTFVSILVIVIVMKWNFIAVVCTILAALFGSMMYLINITSKKIKAIEEILNSPTTTENILTSDYSLTLGAIFLILGLFVMIIFVMSYFFYIK